MTHGKLGPLWSARELLTLYQRYLEYEFFFLTSCCYLQMQFSGVYLEGDERKEVKRGPVRP